VKPDRVELQSALHLLSMSAFGICRSNLGLHVLGLHANARLDPSWQKYDLACRMKQTRNPPCNQPCAILIKDKA
jgi:hypothetical protein